jgi:type IX secretion system PorP/SprF family membrane protein
MKKIAILSFLLVLSSSSMAQDPTFTQFYANPLYLNPALAGSHGCPRFASNYRNEWPNLSGNYVTYSVSYDQYFKNISGGFGVLATHDQQGQGTINTSMLGLIYSYHLPLGRKWKMMFGARAAWYQKFLDWDKLTFGDMIDPRRGFIYATGDVPRGGSRGFFDASTGVVVFNKSFFAGAAWHHMNRPNESMIIGNSPLPWRFTGHMGAEIQLGKSRNIRMERA